MDEQGGNEVRGRYVLVYLWWRLDPSDVGKMLFLPGVRHQARHQHQCARDGPDVLYVMYGPVLHMVRLEVLEGLRVHATQKEN